MGEAEQPVDGWRVLEQASELADRGEPFALATVVWRQGPSSSQQGSRAIITAAGELYGWIGGACAQPTVIREAKQVITGGVPRLLLLGSPEQFGGAVADGMTVVPISCQSEGALEVYIEPVLPAPHLVVVGGSPMAQTLASLARTLGWRAELIAGADFTAADATPRSLVVIATQGQGDEDTVERAVQARPAYLGLVGSRRRGSAVLGYLAERGVPREELGRVHVPAGVDLGRITHQEIAVAILAELIQLRASGALGTPAAPAPPAAATAEARPPEAEVRPPEAEAQPLEAEARPPEAEAQPLEAEVTDPVCGMTVLAGPEGSPAARGRGPVEHDGLTYYFCSAGCRRAFQDDPARYLPNPLPGDDAGLTEESRC